MAKINACYITFNDAPGGIFKGQVCEVIHLLNSNTNLDLKLLSFISIRNFLTQKKQIKQWAPNAVVIPMIPGIQNWRINRFILSFIGVFKTAEMVISRGIFAANLAIMARKKNQKIVYVGRGAIYHEALEFDVFGNKLPALAIKNIEQTVVLKSHYRIAVSHKLVEYWTNQYGYKGGMETIVPCLTWSDKTNDGALKAFPQQWQWDNNSIFLVYSGSVSPWQSFDYMIDIVEKLMRQNEKICFLSLCPWHPKIDTLQQAFKGRVKNLFVKPHEVQAYLKLCDYGLLIREEYQTNKVSSPVKFAEYLHSGLQLLISPWIGDYSTVCKEEKLGKWTTNQDIPVLEKPNQHDKDKSIQYCKEHLSLHSQKALNQYKEMLKAINTITEPV